MAPTWRRGGHSETPRVRSQDACRIDSRGSAGRSGPFPEALTEGQRDTRNWPDLAAGIQWANQPETNEFAGWIEVARNPTRSFPWAKSILIAGWFPTVGQDRSMGRQNAGVLIDSVGAASYGVCTESVRSIQNALCGLVGDLQDGIEWLCRTELWSFPEWLTQGQRETGGCWSSARSHIWERNRRNCWNPAN